MSWRSNSQRTGENAAPLAKVRRWGGGGGDEASPPAPPSAGYNGNGASSYGSPPVSQSYNGASQPYGGPSGLPSIPSAAAAAANRAAEIAARLNGGGLAADKRGREDGSGTPDDGGEDVLALCMTPSSEAVLAHLDAFFDSLCSPAPRKRKSRWGDAAPAANVTTAITGAVSVADLDRYAVQVRLDEISNKLRTGDVVPSERERSPSPPPTYDAQGRRTNTREVRYRKKLEDERIQLVERQMKMDPNFRPPAEYAATKRNRQPMEKVYLPLKEFPEINFFGLLVGPRGNTLKGMERESGAKIAIRGKGSVKDGKGRGDEEDQEEMHCVITADDEAKVKNCVRLINGVIEVAASTPESQNDHKRNQLRELATLNGTLRDDENQVCQNCGMKGHRRFECTEDRNFTAHIICHRCGGQGHLARDCTQPRMGGGMQPGGGFGGPGGPAQGGPAGPGGGFDSEYASLMAELGEGGAPGGPGGPGGPRGGSGTPQQGGFGGHGPGVGGSSTPNTVGPDGKKIPPWRQPDVWAQPSFGGGGGRGPRFGGPGQHGGYGGPAASGANAHGGPGQGWGSAPGAGGGGGGYGGGAAGGWGQQGHAAQGGAEGQQDYSAEWAAYYAQQAAQQQGGQQPAAEGAAAAGGEQKDYSKEWEE
jgi:splicing factor 1